MTDVVDLDLNFGTGSATCFLRIGAAVRKSRMCHPTLTMCASSYLATGEPETIWALRGVAVCMQRWTLFMG